MGQPFLGDVYFEYVPYVPLKLLKNCFMKTNFMGSSGSLKVEQLFCILHFNFYSPTTPTFCFVFKYSPASP